MALIPIASTAITRPPLFGQDEISVPSNAKLIFTHQAFPDDPLYIHSGATAIKWAYHLNTLSTPTLGGEVVQVLSAVVGPLTITGQTSGLKTNKTGRIDTSKEVHGWKKEGIRQNWSPNHELESIIKWFRTYIARAGTQSQGNFYRDERAIEFQYPERGWKFYIQVTKLDGFRYDREVIAPEWSITAEIVSDNALDYFSGITMASFTDDLVANQTLLGQIGLSAFANSTTETNNPNFGQTGDFGSSNPFLNPQLAPVGLDANTIAGTMGDNFQALLAAWNGGNFATFGFGALLDNGALPKNVDAAYQKYFGTSFLGRLPGNSGTGSTNAPKPGYAGGVYTYPGKDPTKDLAATIVNAWLAAGMPAELGLACAIHESRLNPDARNPHDGDNDTLYPKLRIDGVGLFQAHNPGGADPSEACRLASSVDYDNPPTVHYPTAIQINNATVWFRNARPAGFGPANLTNDQLAQWAFAAQKGTGYLSGSSCTGQFASEIAQAKSYIAGFIPPTSGAASGVRLNVIAIAQKIVQQYNKTGRPSYSESGSRNVESWTPLDWSQVPVLDCSIALALCYCWGTDDDHRYALNGSTYNGTNTATIYETWKSKVLGSEDQARAGDIIIYGYDQPLANQHAEMFIEDYNGPDTATFSFGANPPTIGAFSSLKTGRPYVVISILP